MELKKGKILGFFGRMPNGILVKGPLHEVISAGSKKVLLRAYGKQKGHLWDRSLVEEFIKRGYLVPYREVKHE